MLLAALSNAVCLYNVFFVIDFCKCFLFHACLGLLTHILFTSSMIFRSCAVLLICWFFLILCSHHFLCEKAMCSLEK